MRYALVTLIAAPDKATSAALTVVAAVSTNAIVFVVFDVEAVFLFPFAVALKQLPMYALVWAVVFIVLLVDGLLYGWRKGALHWN